MSTAITPYDRASLSERQQYASTLANGGELIPKGLWAPVRKADGTMSPPQPSAGKVLLVMETGAMLGIHPVAALQGVHIIEGKATLSPALMSAVVRKAGHQLRVRTAGSIKGGDFAATATLTRADDSDFTYEATWTTERAERAGLMGKDVWKKYPEAMCKARAISEVCREGAEDALMGVHYTPEELDAPVDQSGDAQIADADVVDVEPEPAEDWEAAIEECTTKDEVKAVVARCQEAGEFTDTVRTFALTKYGMLRRAEEPPKPDESKAEPDPHAEVIEGAEEVPDESSAEPDEAEYERIAAEEFADAVARGEVQP